MAGLLLRQGKLELQNFPAMLGFDLPVRYLIEDKHYAKSHAKN